MGNRVDFIGIPLDNLSMAETLDRIENSIFSGNEYSQKILNEEGICLLPGECFGENGKGFLRLSYSQTSIDTILIAIEKIKKFHNKYF